MKLVTTLILRRTTTTVCNRRTKPTPILVYSLSIPAWSGVRKRSAFHHTRDGISGRVGIIVPLRALVGAGFVVVRIAAICD